MYDDYKNIETDTKVSTLGNDASKNLYVKMKAGAWTQVRNADFGKEGAMSFVLRAKGTGKLEIRFTKTGEAMATVEFSNDSWTDNVIEVDPEVFKSKHNLFFVFTEADKVQFDAWNFSHEPATNGIFPIRTNETQKPTALFDLNGHRLTGGTPYRGVVIEQYQDENGKTQSRKRMSANTVH